MSPARIAVILLAAGRGERFGGGKLAAMLGDRPVAHHAADMLRTIGFARHIAVIGPDTPALPGWSGILLNPPGTPLSRSLALGVAAADDADAVLIALADMPFIGAAHIAAMLRAFDGDRLASRHAGIAMPPALFGAGAFPALRAQAGDRGAGALLRHAPAIDLPDAAALDIDRPADLALAQTMCDSTK